MLEVAKSLKVATEVRWSATRSLAVHSLTMHSLAECSSATEALALEAAALIMAVEARSAAVLTVVGGAGEEGGGAFVGGGIENVAPSSEALALETAVAAAENFIVRS